MTQVKEDFSSFSKIDALTRIPSFLLRTGFHTEMHESHYKLNSLKTGFHTKGRLNQKEVNAASKGVSAVGTPELVSAAEPTIFDDEDIAQRLHDEKVQKATARDKQEKVDMKRALVLQRQYNDKEDNIYWSVVVEQCLSAKRTAWNEFSCSMASDVICLATGRKFNFSKYIFNSMVRNVDSPSKFLIYPRFLQVVMDNQVDDMITPNTRYTSPALTQKVFANIRRVRKDFSGVETPLFASMLVQPQPQAEEEVEVPIAPAPPSTTSAPSPPAFQDPTPTPHATPPQDQPQD
nr:hypothetical protein [Tanacetum cinerariifolium]